MAEKEYINLYECRDDFYATVLDILSEDSTNDRANQIIDAFDYLPAADVVEVVRCKDCIFKDYPNEYGVCCCNRTGEEIQLNDFCSYGERNEDGNG